MSAIEEGKCAYTLGSDGSDNPYRKAKESMRDDWIDSITDYRIGLSVLLGRIQYNDARYQELMDLECQWDSGYAVAKRITVQKEIDLDLIEELRMNGPSLKMKGGDDSAGS